MKKRGSKISKKKTKKAFSHREHGLLLSEKRTHLAQKRTELSHERTLLSYTRTATTLVLFGIAFLGISKTKLDFFYFAGVIAISAGVIFTVIAIVRGMKHAHEIRKIRNFFEKLIRFRYKK